MEFEQAIQRLSSIYPQLTICVFDDKEKEQSCYERWRKLQVTKDNEEILPINTELINDWLFCHNHDHNGAHEEYEKLKTLTNVRQINKLLIQSYADYPDEYIFESQDGQVSVYVSVQNSSWYFCQAVNTDAESKRVPFNLIKASYLHYKIYRKDSSNFKEQELSNLRLSFTVDWFRASDQVIVELIDILEESNKRLHTPSKKATALKAVGKQNDMIELNCGFIGREDINQFTNDLVPVLETLKLED